LGHAQPKDRIDEFFQHIPWKDNLVRALAGRMSKKYNSVNYVVQYGYEADRFITWFSHKEDLNKTVILVKILT
jgi:hypothetical protein